MDFHELQGVDEPWDLKAFLVDPFDDLVEQRRLDVFNSEDKRLTLSEVFDAGGMEVWRLGTDDKAVKFERNSFGTDENRDVAELFMVSETVCLGSVWFRIPSEREGKGKLWVIYL